MKELDLINRVPEELWMEVNDIVQEAVIRIIAKKKKCKKAKWLSEEALQIAEKRREVREKGEKERYTPLNAEFQRIAGRDKKAFLSDQCKVHHSMTLKIANHVMGIKTAGKTPTPQGNKAECLNIGAVRMAFCHLQRPSEQIT